MDRTTWLISCCVLVVFAACKTQAPDSTPTVSDDAKDPIVAIATESSNADGAVDHDGESEGTTSSSKVKGQDYPFDLGELVPRPEVTPTLILVGGGWCPGALPLAEQVAATKINVERPPKEIKREYFLKSVLSTYSHPGQNVKVDNPEAMRDFFKRTITYLESHYASATFSKRLEKFTCVLADEDAGCDRIVCVAPPTRAYSDGSSPEQLWVVTDVAFGNVRNGE